MYVQSLQMNIPPDVPHDEAIPTGGEVQMHLSAEGISVVEATQGAAINPVYVA